MFNYTITDGVKMWIIERTYCLKVSRKFVFMFSLCLSYFRISFSLKIALPVHVLDEDGSLIRVFAGLAIY